jgi:hypothetical protein
MKKYFFYSKLDPKCESISSIKSNSKDEAIKFFSEQKKLSIKNFLKIFNVK